MSQVRQLSVCVIGRDDACMHSQCPWGCPKGGIAVELRLSWHDFKSNCYDLYVLVVFVLGFPVWCLLGCERWVNDHFRHHPEPHEDHWQHTRRGTRRERHLCC